MSWIVKVCPKLTHFHTWRAQIGPQIHSISNLTKLIIQQSTIDHPDTLSSLKSIKLLKISGCLFENKKPVKLSDLVPFCNKNPDAKLIFQSGKEEITSVPKSEPLSLYETYHLMKMNGVSITGTDAVLEHCEEAAHLELNGITISDDVIAQLASMKNLESLGIIDCHEMDNEKLAKIAELCGSTLKSISIQKNSKVDWKWVNNLLPLEKIEDVKIGGNNPSIWISMPEFSFLMAKGPQLKSYRLTDIHVGAIFSEVGATPSIELGNLEELSHTDLADAQLEWITKKSPNLKSIETSGDGNIGEGLYTMLSTLKKLERVVLSSTMSLDTSIFSKLAKIPELPLRELVIDDCTDLSGNRINLKDLVPLLKKHPQIQLTYFSKGS